VDGTIQEHQQPSCINDLVHTSLISFTFEMGIIMSIIIIIIIIIYFPL
jgi:hypothetical protein